jgi:hypothetical protein
MGRYLHNAHRTERGLPQFARLFERRRGLTRTGTDHPGPTHGSVRHAPPRFSRCHSKSLALLAALLIVSIGAIAARAAEPGNPVQLDGSAGGSCSAIRHALSELGQAEHDQAFALELFSRGGELPMVEVRYQRMQQADGDLREILRRVRASRLGADPSVSECRRLGYRSLFASEKVGSEVERILTKAHGEPLVHLDDGSQ